MGDDRTPLVKITSRHVMVLLSGLEQQTWVDT